MTMTSDTLLHDLREIGWLMAALGTPVGQEDAEDLAWLRARRRFLLALLAVRRQQRGKKVVNLALWRDGAATRVSARAA